MQSRSTKQQPGTDDAHLGSIVANSKYIIHHEDTPKKIKIVKSKEQIKECHPELFEGLGRFPGEPYHISINPSITPKQTPCRPLPVHLKDTFRQKINKMLTAGVINLSMKQHHGSTASF